MLAGQHFQIFPHLNVFQNKSLEESITFVYFQLESVAPTMSQEIMLSLCLLSYIFACTQCENSSFQIRSYRGQTRQTDAVLLATMSFGAAVSEKSKCLARLWGPLSHRKIINRVHRSYGECSSPLSLGFFVACSIFI